MNSCGAEDIVASFLLAEASNGDTSKEKTLSLTSSDNLDDDTLRLELFKLEAKRGRQTGLVGLSFSLLACT